VDRADPDRRQEQDDRLRAEGHVDGDAVAFGEPEAAQCGGRALDLGEEQLIVEGSPLAPLVQVDEGEALAAAVLHVRVERAGTQVRPPPTNHLKLGGCASKTRSHFRTQGSAEAARAQNSSGSRRASSRKRPIGDSLTTPRV
jgi:hypothetical protein